MVQPGWENASQPSWKGIGAERCWDASQPSWKGTGTVKCWEVCFAIHDRTLLGERVPTKLGRTKCWEMCFTTEYKESN